MAWASTSPLASSTLVSSSTTGWPGARPCRPTPSASLRASATDPPTTTWTTLGRPSISREPAPNPVAAMRMAGSGPHDTTVAARSAAPVGVVSSTGTSTPWVGAPRNRATTAGAGLGSSPWAERIIPVPVATGLAWTASTPRTSSAAAVPTTSTMASSPPTSWKWTCSGGPPVQLPLDVGQRPERAQRPPGDPLGQPGLLDHPGDVRRGAHDRRLDDVHVRLGGGDAAAEHGLGLEPPAVDRQTPQQVPHLVEVGPGVEQRPQRHVARDPREAVEPGDGARPGHDKSSTRPLGPSGPAAKDGRSRLI